MSKLHKPLKVSLFKAQTRKDTFLDPVSETSENSKSTDLQVRLFVTNFMLCIKLFIHSVINGLHKTSEGLFKVGTP